MRDAPARAGRSERQHNRRVGARVAPTLASPQCAWSGERQDIAARRRRLSAVIVDAGRVSSHQHAPAHASRANWQRASQLAICVGIWVRPPRGGCRRVRCARAQRAPGGHESQPAVAATRDGASFCTNIHSRRRAIWDRTQSAAMSNAREPSWAAQIEPSRIRERKTQRVPSRQPRGELIDRADPMPARIGDGQSSHSRGSHRRAFGDLAHQSPFISAPAHA